MIILFLNRSIIALRIKIRTFVISGAIDLPNGPSIVLVRLFGFLAVALSCHAFNL
jgi:hypothetical protein